MGDLAAVNGVRARALELELNGPSARFQAIGQGVHRYGLDLHLGSEPPGKRCGRGHSGYLTPSGVIFTEAWQ